jgi:hypothetical protein
MPRIAVGAAAPSSASATSQKAVCAVGQDTPDAAATSEQARFASPIAAAIACRSRLVVRVRAGTSVMDSVKLRRSHNGSRQRQRRLCHTIAIFDRRVTTPFCPQSRLVP